MKIICEKMLSIIKKTDDIIAEIITAKNRNGQTKTNKLNWIGEYQRFTSADVIKQ
uniref:hypothetical protein n=1 Tax=Clostridium butyricum TaxID=1492 RepID=UPI002ABE6A9C|nr:hypothetical protein [Clostridium butyricum]